MMKHFAKYLSLISYSICLLILCGCGENTSPVISTASSSPDSVITPGLEPDSTDEAVPPTETDSPLATDSSGSSETTVAPTDTTATTQPAETTQAPVQTQAPTQEPTSEPTPEPIPTGGLRGSTSYCLVPSADGTAETHNEYASIDYSHASEGYIMARYTGTCPKVKMQIKFTGANTYTYNLVGNEYEAFPLPSGSGTYEITILENVVDTSYLVSLSASIDVQISNTYGPFLYPNQYCMFTSSSQTVAKAAELAQDANNDLDVVASVYNYVINSISYDYEKAQTVPSGYTANVDEILASGTGICLDYAAVMTCMLRSQQIPTRLEVGYVGDAYHAWISTYIKDVGWVNGIVQFDGTSWKLMDPTFAANSSEKDLREFIGDGSGYIVKYQY